MEYESPRARPRGSDFDLIEQLADPRQHEPIDILIGREMLDRFRQSDHATEQARPQRGEDWVREFFR